MIGSPPRMREELHKPPETRKVGRITPAHAGRIFSRNKYLFQTGDHPRACGKNKEPLYARIVRQGSPPRMREEYNK